MEQGFRLLNKFSSLPPKARLEVKNSLRRFMPEAGAELAIEDLKQARENLLSIVKGESLVSFCLYSSTPRGEGVFIEFIWGRPSANFLREYGVSASTYLLEEFVRRGATKLYARKLATGGLKMARRLEREGFLSMKQVSPPSLDWGSGWGEHFSVKPSWKTNAFKRRRLPA